MRWALGLTMLSAVADRFGFWGPPGTTNVSWGNWSRFVDYTEKVNSFLPSGYAGVLAVLATSAEIGLAFGLLLGVFRRTVAFGSAALLGLFALSMTISFGVKAPLNFSVFADAAAALLLSVWPENETK
ncbi:MAG: DoxX family protein [Verrucomicrobia bacterium]|nr:DoxX family protein [Verrucomicrobiota bacterium]